MTQTKSEKEAVSSTSGPASPEALRVYAAKLEQSLSHESPNGDLHYVVATNEMGNSDLYKIAEQSAPKRHLFGNRIRWAADTIRRAKTDEL